MQTTNGSLNPPNRIKFIWGIIQSATAVILLWSGGLGALQMASIVAAFPFEIIMILMVFSLVKSLREEKVKNNQNLSKEFKKMETNLVKIKG